MLGRLICELYESKCLQTDQLELDTFLHFFFFFVVVDTYPQQRGQFPTTVISDSQSKP